MNNIFFYLSAGTAFLLMTFAQAQSVGYPHPVTNPASPLMLTGDWLPDDHHEIDFSTLPQLPIEHIVISDVFAENGVNQHNYLIHHNGRFWAMWSDGPSLEDKAGQIVKYSTSNDGVNWNKPSMMTPYPPDSEPGSEFYNTRDGGWRYISRGFWVREGRLLALASLDEASGFFGPSLALHAFEWNEALHQWDDIGVVQTNAINNFPPKLLPSGEWAMSRRKYDYQHSGVQFLIGGVSALNDWLSFPVITDSSSTLKAEEPLWWTLPDNSLVALFRDNGGGHYLYRSFSTDNGRTWTTPAKTDFPDATSKIFGMRLSDGRYAFVSNPNPDKRDPMTLALSDDGLVFDRMFYLTGGRHVDYPHMIEHEGYLYIAHSGAKHSVEIERITLSNLNSMQMPRPLPEEIIALFTFADMAADNDGTTTAIKQSDSTFVPTLTIVEDEGSLVDANGQMGVIFTDLDGDEHNDTISAAWTSGLLNTANAGQNYFVLESSTIGFEKLKLHLNTYSTSGTGPSELTLDYADGNNAFQPLGTLTLSRNSQWQSFTNELSASEMEPAARIRIRGTWSADATFGSGRIDNLQLSGRRILPENTNAAEIIAYYPFTGNSLTNTAAHPRITTSSIVATNTGAMGFNSTTVSPESGVPVMTVSGLAGGIPDRYISFDIAVSPRTVLSAPSIELYAKAGSGTGTMQLVLVSDNISYQLGMYLIDATLQKYSFTLPDNLYPSFTGNAQLRIYGSGFATEATTLRIDDLTVKAVVKELPSKCTVVTISQFKR